MVEAGRRLDEARFVAMTQRSFDREAPGFDAVLVRFQTSLGESVMRSGSRLRAILSPTTGLDHIDLEAARRHGVKVFHLRDQKKLLASVSATAELTIALMLALMRKLPQAAGSVLGDRWQTANFRGAEAAGKVLGIVGYGRLGRKVARTAHALGMKVHAYDIRRAAMPAFVTRCRTLPALLRKADVVSIHVPLNDETRGMIGRSELRRIKPGALLLNTARAAIVDQRAFLDALKSGQLGGAAVDVLEGEHTIGSAKHPLIAYARSHNNLLITPHIGGATEESIEKTDMNVLQRYLNWIGRNSHA